MLIRAIKNALLDFFFPICCVGCKKGKTYCCGECFGKIPLLPAETLRAQIEIASEKHINHLIAAAQFRENSILAKLIHIFKYSGAKQIGGLLLPLFQNLELPPNSILIPVPLHWRRKNMRGYNQSEILARELARKFNVPIQNILKRHRYTKPQAELKAEERRTNVAAAFSLSSPAVRPDPNAIYLLVDDVFTTGSTINECCRALKRHGAKIVWGLVIAKT